MKWFWFIASANILYICITFHELPGEITVTGVFYDSHIFIELYYLFTVGNPVISNNINNSPEFHSATDVIRTSVLFAAQTQN